MSKQTEYLFSCPQGLLENVQRDEKCLEVAYFGTYRGLLQGGCL